MLSVDVQMEPFYVRDFTLRCVGFVMISGCFWYPRLA